MTPRTSQPAGISIPDVRAELNGAVIAPDDPAYEEARTVFYTGFDRRPAAIVRAADATDVARAVGLARETGVELAVRSGGHSPAGHGTTDGGIVLDLSEMQAVEIDAEGRTAWAEPGIKAGQYTAAVGAHGLATGFGDYGGVGVGGITLGGGIGYLVRKHGLTIDDLLAAEIVTADGRVLRVNAETEPDLFWAIRGGGGNFGVATRFQFRLHELERIVGGMLMLPATPEVIESFLAAAEAAPEELSTIANVALAPPLPFVPAEQHGRPVLMGLLAYAGEAEAGERAIAPFRELATPLVDMVHPMTYHEIFALTRDAPHPVAAASRNMFVDRIDRGGAEAIVDHLERASAQMAVAQLRVLGGAMARVPADATAFAHRERRIMVNVAATYEQPEEAPEHEAWVASLSSALSDGEPGAYVGFVPDAGEEGVHEAYPESTWERLAAIKRRYDPDNLFRLNHNVQPAAS